MYEYLAKRQDFTTYVVLHESLHSEPLYTRTVIRVQKLKHD